MTYDVFGGTLNLAQPIAQPLHHGFLTITALYKSTYWVKKCMEYEVVVQKDCQARKLNREDGMGHSRWRNLIKDH